MTDNKNTTQDFLVRSAEVKELGIKVSDCFLAQAMFTSAGIITGTIIGYKTKSFTPLIIASGIGTAADFAYGRNVACKTLINQLNFAKRSLKDDYPEDQI